MQKSEIVLAWAQVLTGIAVLAGLVLVVWELQQNRELAKAQLVSSEHDSDMSFWAAHVGEDHHDIQVKACIAPDSLTEADLVILDRIYAMYFTRANRILEIQKTSQLFSEAELERRVAMTILVLYGTDHGRWWWENNKDWQSSELRSITIRLTQKLGPTQCGEYVENWKALRPFNESWDDEAQDSLWD